MPNYVSFMSPEMYESLKIAKKDDDIKMVDYLGLVKSMEEYIRNVVCKNISAQDDVDTNATELKNYMRLITISQMFPYYVRTYISIYMRQWIVDDSNPYAKDMICDSNNPDNYITTNNKNPKTDIIKKQSNYYTHHCGSGYVVSPTYVTPVPFR
jgi:hypothetical protein